MQTHRSADAHVHGHDAVALARLALKISIREERARRIKRHGYGSTGEGGIRQEIQRPKSMLNFPTVLVEKGNRRKFEIPLLFR